MSSINNWGGKKRKKIRPLSSFNARPKRVQNGARLLSAAGKRPDVAPIPLVGLADKKLWQKSDLRLQKRLIHPATCWTICLCGSARHRSSVHGVIIFLVASF